MSMYVSCTPLTELSSVAKTRVQERPEISSSHTPRKKRGTGFSGPLAISIRIYTLCLGFAHVSTNEILLYTTIYPVLNFALSI